MRFDKPSLERNRSLDSLLTEFSLYVKELCPEASIEITKTIYEDEDANIVVRPPVQWTVEATRCPGRRPAERSIDILLQTGYHILIGVFEPAIG